MNRWGTGAIIKCYVRKVGEQIYLALESTVLQSKSHSASVRLPREIPPSQRDRHHSLRIGSYDNHAMGNEAMRHGPWGNTRRGNTPTASLK